MKVQINRRRGIFLMAILVSTLAGSAQAGGTKTVNLTLHLVITQLPPCTVNGASIEFGNVMTNKVGDATYTRPVEYSLSCPNAKLGDYLRLQIQGTPPLLLAKLCCKLLLPDWESVCNKQGVRRWFQ